MRTLFLIFAIAAATTLFAQDEYPDYRSKKEFFSKMQEKDLRADIATFSIAGIEEGVGKTPLNSIPITGYGKDYLTFEEYNTKVTIQTMPFEPGKRKFIYADPEKKDYLLKIDNKGYYGNYGKMPKTVVSQVTVIIDRDTIVIPPAACTDLCNPTLTFDEGGKTKSQNKVFRSADGKRLYIYMLKQEAGGSYEVTWVIQDKKYVRRVVDFGFLK